MTEHKYPRGAVKTLEELHPLVKRARAGKTVKVYTVKRDGVTAGIEASTISGINRHQLLIFDNDGYDSFFNLEYLNIPTWFAERPEADKWFLFTNYWLAFAEVCRRQAQAEKNVDG